MQHTNEQARVRWLQRQRGRFVTLTCATSTVRLLLLAVYRDDGTWWLAGYDDGNIGEPLMVGFAEVTQMRGERPFRCPTLASRQWRRRARAPR